MSSIAVIVTCHEPYLKWLLQAIDSINRQVPSPQECIIVCDGCNPPAINDDRWRLIEGMWGNPSNARNAGLAAAEAPWLIFWDADNVMPPGYIAAIQQAISTAPSDTAIVYPDIQFCDEGLTAQKLWKLPAWDYWGMRAENCVDTASAWRREAIDMVGGWSDRAGAFEDYALALDITACGWKAEKAQGPPILQRIHSKGRRQKQQSSGKVLADLWMARSLAIVSLLAGRDNTFDRWVDFLLNAELSPKTALYIVDNSGRSEFTRIAFEACQRIAGMRGLSHVNFESYGRTYQISSAKPYLEKGRHLHVARLYASIFPRVSEDLILTLEDDIQPPLDAIRRLGEEVGYRTRGNIGAVGAAYSMPYDESLVCAGYGSDMGWGSTVKWSRLPAKVFDVGCVGGGCTMWANWALQGFPVHLQWNKRLGWDGVLSIALKQRGYRVRLHGNVRCKHHTHGQLKDRPARF